MDQGDPRAEDRRARSPASVRLPHALVVASNVLLAGYFVYGAYESLVPSPVWYPVRLLECASSLALGILVLFRAPAAAVRWDVPAIVAVVVSNAHGFAFASDASTSVAAETAGRVAMAAAATWGSVSRLFLGRSFAILPAVRDVRTRGPYAVVRHPIYLSLAVYDVGFLASHASLRNAGVAAAGIVAHVARLVLEERLLSRDPAYVAFRNVTRWRMIPLIW